MSNYDFRDQEPLWVRYAEYVGDGSDKYYEVRIDMDDAGLFIMTKRWGARPDVGRGQIQTQTFSRVEHATQAAHHQLGSKVAKGYRECDRPLAASREVDQGDEE